MPRTRGQGVIRRRERLVPFGSRGARREAQRVEAVRFVGEDLLAVRERPRRFAVDEQPGEVQPQRGVARVGRDGGLEGGDDCGIGRQREEPRSVRGRGWCGSGLSIAAPPPVPAPGPGPGSACPTRPDPAARGVRSEVASGVPVAEGVGFEPTVTCATMVFETIRFGRSRIPPGRDVR